MPVNLPIDYMRATNTRGAHKFEIDGATIGIIVGGIVAITTAFLTGLWSWLSGKKKSELDEQASLIAGFTALLASIRAERDHLMKRLDDCEIQNGRQDRRIIRLERILLGGFSGYGGGPFYGYGYYGGGGLGLVIIILLILVLLGRI